MAGGVFEPRQIDGPHGSQHGAVLLRRTARRHRGEGGCVHAPAVAGIKLCICLRVRSAGSGPAQTGQLRERFESSRQRAESQLLPGVSAPACVLRFQFSDPADHLILRPVHQRLQSLLQLPLFAFVDGRPDLGCIEQVSFLGAARFSHSTMPE